MPILGGPGGPEDNNLPFDFSRAGGFRIGDLSDLQKAQLLHRVADWAKEAMLAGLVASPDNPRWREHFAPLLESLMKAAHQVAIYMDNDQLRWDANQQGG